MIALGVAVVQFSPTADAAANLALIGGLVATASDRGARVVVFPEYSSYFVDPFDESLRRMPKTSTGRSPGRCRRLPRNTM